MNAALSLEQRADMALQSTAGLHLVPTDLYAHQTPPAYVIDRLVPRGEVTLLTANGGGGKTVLAEILTAHVAIGRTWAGFGVDQGPALYCSLEDSGEQVNFRLRRLADAYGLDREVIMENVVILDGSDGDGVLSGEVRDRETGTMRIGYTIATETLRQAAKGCALIVVDNASDGFDANENDRRSVRAFVRMLKHIARENNAGVILLAHIDKFAARNGAQGSSYSGSTAWHNSARSRLALMNDGDGVLLTQEKAQFGRPVEPVRLRWTDNGVLYPLEPTETRVVERDDEGTVMAALRAAWTVGVDVGTGRSGPGNTQMTLETFPELPEYLHGKNGRKPFLAALGNLITSGKVEKRVIKTRSRNCKEIFADPGSRVSFVSSDFPNSREPPRNPASPVRCKEAQGCGEHTQRTEPQTSELTQATSICEEAEL